MADGHSTAHEAKSQAVRTASLIISRCGGSRKPRVLLITGRLIPNRVRNGWPLSRRWRSSSAWTFGSPRKGGFPQKSSSVGGGGGRGGYEKMGQQGHRSTIHREALLSAGTAMKGRAMRRSVPVSYRVFRRSLPRDQAWTTGIVTRISTGTDGVHHEDSGGPWTAGCPGRWLFSIRIGLF